MQLGRKREHPLNTSDHFCVFLIALLGHPEHFLEDKIIRDMTKASWAKKVTHKFIIKAHCVVTWSQNFQPKYHKLDRLTAMFPMQLGRKREHLLNKSNHFSVFLIALLGHSEHFLEDKTIRDMNMASGAKKVKHIFIIKAHCVVTWSQNFQPKYCKFDELRAIFQCNWFEKENIPWTHLPTFLSSW